MADHIRPPSIVVDADHMAVKGCQQNHPELKRGSKLRLFETNENETRDSAGPCSNDKKMPHCKIYHPVIELTTVRARERVCAYGTPVAFGLRNTKGETIERKDAKGTNSEVWTRNQWQKGRKEHISRCEGQKTLGPGARGQGGGRSGDLSNGKRESKEHCLTNVRVRYVRHGKLT